MRTLLAALAALVAVACSQGKERESEAPPTSSAPAPRAVKVDPPADAAAPAPADAGAALAPELVLTLTPDGKTFLGDKPVEAASLAAELEKATALADALVIAADKKVPHGRIVEVMEMAKKAGFRKMSIKTGSPP
jgi:biopolymer transport protein ExbD